jgi:hypothetical protein
VLGYQPITHLCDTYYITPTSCDHSTYYITLLFVYRSLSCHSFFPDTEVLPARLGQIDNCYKQFNNISIEVQFQYNTVCSYIHNFGLKAKNIQILVYYLYMYVLRCSTNILTFRQWVDLAYSKVISSLTARRSRHIHINDRVSFKQAGLNGISGVCQCRHGSP